MRRKLDQHEIGDRLTALPGWSVVEGELTREYAFATYKEGLVFATYVGYLADRRDHHPDLLIGYRKVKVSLSTHDAGGLTASDFDLAAEIGG